MRTKIVTIIFSICICLSVGLAVSNQLATAASSGKCKGTSFFGLPTWYKYLDFENGDNCDLIFDAQKPTDYYLVGLAILEMLLMLAGILAVVFVVVGGYKYTIAQGNPEKIANARQTIQNALIGVVIAVIASRVVAALATKIS